MPKNKDLKKILVIGSGPIIIGQAAEFDYAGTQACKALKEENIEVILVNNNPATIMTDTDIADKVYSEPLTISFLEKIIAKERPDGILATLGGQAGLNLAFELYENNILEKYNTKLLGTSIEAIKKAEDRDLFKKTMEKLGEPVPESAIVEDVSSAIDFANEINYPIIVRPAYTMGGTGGGIAENEEELVEIVIRGLKASMIGQVIIERCVAGWKEIEYEVIRDKDDNCITVCNMENFDPVGVHTGDSIVVAPSQTLTDEQYQMLRRASINIIRELGIKGGCNAQYALDPKTNKYYVIEVNPRVSRSSALASKATGYPIAKVSTKIAIGYTLDEIVNDVTKKTKACFEPALDYCVVKFPRWPFDKFIYANRTLGTQMKATGEVMAIERTFEGAILKAIRSLEIGLTHIRGKKVSTWDNERLLRNINRIDDERIFVIAEILRRDLMTVEGIHVLTKIDRWFIRKIKNIIDIENELIKNKSNLTVELLKKAKNINISDEEIGFLTGRSSSEIRTLRLKYNILPFFKMVDTCAGEFEATSSYYYSTYHASEDEIVLKEKKRKVIVLGSGPIRIGQGVEFDYCSVHCIWALRKMGIEAVIINNNPETVSTDFDISDRLYFEPLTKEDVLNVIDKEKPEGVIVQFGGQTAINLAQSLQKEGVKILGTSVDSIDCAEDRERFEKLLESQHILRPKGSTVTDEREALKVAEKIGYPCVIRPSYVLGGRAMEIVYNKEELIDYIKRAVRVSEKHPVLIDHYMQGREVEVDAICDGENVVIPGIMEHIERAGVHSGDSIAVYPPQTLSSRIIYTIIDNTKRLALSLKVKGLLNIQYVVLNEHVYVIEVNPRSSRTVPFLSKITNIPMVELATRSIMGETLAKNGYKSGLIEPKSYVALKAPVFSFSKMQDVDISLGPEMKSTGEVMGIDKDYSHALYKAIIGTGMNIPKEGSILFTVSDKDKEEMCQLAKGFYELGFKVVATQGTAKAMESLKIPVNVVGKVHEKSADILNLIKAGAINMVINTISNGKNSQRDGFKIRRATVEHGISCLTSLDTAWEVLRVLSIKKSDKNEVLSLQEYTGE